MAVGVTGRLVLEVVPVTNAPAAVAAMLVAVVWFAPRKVRKRRLRLVSYLARKLLVWVGKAALGVAVSVVLVVVPVT